MRKQLKRWAILLGFAAITTVALAATTAEIVRSWTSTGGMLFKTKAGVSVLELGTTAVTAHLPLTTAKGMIDTSSAVALTSPTVTFSAANKGTIVLSANANLTGIYPTGGVLDQRLTIISAASGSNTMRFDDGTSMSLGGSNITLTESVDDSLTLICTSADGDEWRILANPTTAISGTTGNYSGVVTAAGFTIGSAAIVEAELEQLDTVTAGTAVANKAAVLGASYDLDQLSVGNLTHTGTYTRASQVLTFTDMKVSNAGGTDFVITDDSNKATLVASQTSETLIVKITGLHVGDIITGFNLLGQVESAGNEAVIDADLRKITAVASDVTDASAGTITRPTVAADVRLDSTTATSGVLAETVSAYETFYVRVTGTTAASTDIAITGVQLTVTQK